MWPAIIGGVVAIVLLILKKILSAPKKTREEKILDSINRDREKREAAARKGIDHVAVGDRNLRDITLLLLRNKNRNAPKR